MHNYLFVSAVKDLQVDLKEYDSYDSSGLDSDDEMAKVRP